MRGESAGRGDWLVIGREDEERLQNLNADVKMGKALKSCPTK